MQRRNATLISYDRMKFIWRFVKEICRKRTRETIDRRRSIACQFCENANLNFLEQLPGRLSLGSVPYHGAVAKQKYEKQAESIFGGFEGSRSRLNSSWISERRYSCRNKKHNTKEISGRNLGTFIQPS